MQLYKSILVIMDCSSFDNAIIEHVSALAIQNTAQISQLHVVHSHQLRRDRALREYADTYLTHICQKLQDQGIEIRFVLRSGEPDTETPAEIEQHNYDLVAMATHDHSFIGDKCLAVFHEPLNTKLTFLFY